MKLNPTAKTAVVTSASRGIGLATVQTLIDEGDRAMGPARRSSRPSRQAPRRRCTGAHHQQALELARAIGSALGEAHTLAGLSRCATAVGHTARTDDLRARAHIYLLPQ